MGNSNSRGTIPCEEAKEQFNVLLGGKVDVEQRRRVKEHLLNCETCVLAFGDAIAEAIHITGDAVNASGQEQGSTVHFEFVKPATVTQKEELLLTMRPIAAHRNGLILLYKLSNAGVLERLAVIKKREEPGTKPLQPALRANSLPENPAPTMKVLC